MNRLVAIFGSIILFLSVSSDIQRKRIRQGDFDIECYVSIKKIERFNKKKEYFWFKSSEVHNSFANAGGLVLHDEYKKYYKSKQLAEQGIFNYGLKNGTWKKWYENGKLKSVIKWKNGYKSGYYAYYSLDGKLEILGSYKKNIKSNRWINYKTADTTYYKDDSLYVEKPKSKASKFATRIFKKRDSVKVAQKRIERVEKRKQDSISSFYKKKMRKEKKAQDSIKKNLPQKIIVFNYKI